MRCVHHSVANRDLLRRFLFRGRCILNDPKLLANTEEKAGSGDTLRKSCSKTSFTIRRSSD